MIMEVVWLTSVSTYYHEKLAPASDVDLFIYGLNEEQAIEKIKQIEASIRDSILEETTVSSTSIHISPRDLTHPPISRPFARRTPSPSFPSIPSATCRSCCVCIRTFQRFSPGLTSTVLASRTMVPKPGQLPVPSLHWSLRQTPSIYPVVHRPTRVG